jgi:hypothetical protein
MSDQNSKFSYRKFVSLLSTLIFIVISLSGIFLYITPKGRIANWVGWSLLGISKESWGQIHTVFSYLFIIAIAFHIFYNWKTLLSYLKNKLKQFAFTKELIIATIITIIVFIGTNNNLIPFRYVADFGEQIKYLYEKEENNPPTAHAEEYNLIQLSKITKLKVETIAKKLKQNNIKFNSTKEKLADIADNNKMSPKEIYEIIIKDSNIDNSEISHSDGMYSGLGYGRRPLETLCKELNIPLAKALMKLEDKGAKVKGSDIIKNIADQLDMLPIEVIEFLKE